MGFKALFLAAVCAVVVALTSLGGLYLCDIWAKTKFSEAVEAYAEKYSIWLKIQAIPLIGNIASMFIPPAPSFHTTFDGVWYDWKMVYRLDVLKDVLRQLTDLKGMADVELLRQVVFWLLVAFKVACCVVMLATLMTVGLVIWSCIKVIFSCFMFICSYFLGICSWLFQRRIDPVGVDPVGDTATQMNNNNGDDQIKKEKADEDQVDPQEDQLDLEEGQYDLSKYLLDPVEDQFDPEEDQFDLEKEQVDLEEDQVDLEEEKVDEDLVRKIKIIDEKTTIEMRKAIQKRIEWRKKKDAGKGGSVFVFLCVAVCLILGLCYFGTTGKFRPTIFSGWLEKLDWVR